MIYKPKGHNYTVSKTMVQGQRKENLPKNFQRLKKVIKANKLAQFQLTQNNAFINLVVSTTQF